MRHSFSSVTRLAREVASVIILLFVLLSAPVFTGCSDSEVDQPKKEKTEGVELPSSTYRSCTANGATIKVTISTDAGYKIDVDNEEMITLRTNATASSAGTYSVELNVSRNISGEERRGMVYITVDGHSRIKMLEVLQAAGSMDEVVKWVDERLQNEYYWLDEYKEKLTMFDYSLPYDKYLSSSLLSLTTNMEDGGVEPNGSRYIYSYIMREGSGSGASGQMRSSESRNTLGYGIVLATTVWSQTESTCSFAVEHVYPSSPAANMGLKRGDIITHVNGSEIPMTYEIMSDMWESIYYNEGPSISLEGICYNSETGEEIPFKRSLVTSEYEENPVAYSGVLHFDEETEALVNPEGSKKIGYLVYLSFDNQFDDKLIEAVEQLAAEGITDLILDLRINSGGSVNSSITLGSMILPESYIGQTYATLVRNPKNTVISENDECLIVRNGFGDHVLKDLPNLNLEKIWVITSPTTASASEMLIKGFEGLDVEVNMVGKTTEGKNCGMDVIRRNIGSYYYTYAPITFINQNAKGDSDYADGITPQVNLREYMIKQQGEQETEVQQACRYFPMPMVEWSYFQRDIAACEAAFRICGFTILKEEQQGDQNGGDNGEGGENGESGETGEAGEGDQSGTENSGENSESGEAVAKAFKPVVRRTTRTGGVAPTSIYENPLLRGKTSAATLTTEEREELIQLRER